MILNEFFNNPELDEGVSEAGGRRYFDNRTGFRQPPREDDEGHEQDRRREQQMQSGTWYIRLNGKLIRDKQGNPYTYRDKAAANKAAVTMQAKLFNQGKEFVLTTNPNDPQQGVAEGEKEADYGSNYQAMVKRVGQMAKQGERKTVWDPVKRVYKTVPVTQPKEQGMAAGSMNEFAPAGSGDGDSGRWYTDDELADIIGDDWFEDFDVSNDGFNIDTHGEKAKQNLASYANSWFDDRGYNVNVMGVDHNDVDHDLKWYIVGSFQNNNFADKDLEESSQRVDSLVTDALKIMRGSDVTDAVAALKTVLGDREYNDRRGHYNFYVKQLMDMYGQQGVAEEVDTGQYDARKSNAKGATTPDQEKSFREKIKQYSKELEQRQKQKEQGVAEADMSRRGFLKGLGAAAMAGAAGGAMAQSNQQQDLGNGFVLTTINVFGHTVNAVLDTQTGLSFTPNRGSNGSAIIRSQARFLTIKDGKMIDTSMSVGPATTNAMKKAGLVQEGVAEGLDDNVPADRGEYDQEGEMAQQDLTTAVDAAEELRSILSADENLPEWVQAKITKAVDYLDTTRDYMKSKEPELNESRLHRLNLLKTIMIQTP